MSAVPRLWITDRLTIATRACLTLLLVGPGKRLHVLASRKDGHTSARPRHAPRPAHIYTMLVESDVQHGRHGMRPTGRLAPGAYQAELAPCVSFRESERPLSLQRLMGG
jgi:hypothetical protein